ncbi:hypothetical protein PR048_023395 [Dryococelus australis]|uniref:Uncharacterized protein n=1 Tax=Dryococelus australis TaxID=614101 RepID=A0ABQ9GTY5_9NEOP|nr:hypothetical protein PR048_023395 [Dryococelus australis]
MQHILRTVKLTVVRCKTNRISVLSADSVILPMKKVNTQQSANGATIKLWGSDKVRMLKKQDPGSYDENYYVVNCITVVPQNLKHVAKINFKLDLGSEVNNLPEKLFKRVDNQLMVRGTKEILEC